MARVYELLKKMSVLGKGGVLIEQKGRMKVGTAKLHDRDKSSKTASLDSVHAVTTPQSKRSIVSSLCRDGVYALQRRNLVLLITFQS